MPLMPQNKPLSTLTAEDIKALLKDPNSWVYKLYQEILLILVITEEIFIEYLVTAVREQQISKSREEREENKAIARDEEKQQLAAQAEAQHPIPKEEYEQRQTTLAGQLQVLLAINQTHFTLAQLTAHHQVLIANYSNQVMLQLAASPPIVLQNGQVLRVPAVISPPAAPSIAQILAVNPALAAQVLEQQISEAQAAPLPRAETDQVKIAQNPFAAYHTHAEFSHLGTFRLLPDILSHNQINYDALGVADRIKIMKVINAAQAELLPQIGKLKSAILDNNIFSIERVLPELSLKLSDLKSTDEFAFSLTKPPAMFATKHSPVAPPTRPVPTPGLRKKPTEEK